MSHLGPTFTAHKHSTRNDVRQSRDGVSLHRDTTGNERRDVPRLEMRRADTVTGATSVSEHFVPVSKAPLLQTTSRTINRDRVPTRVGLDGVSNYV